MGGFGRIYGRIYGRTSSYIRVYGRILKFRLMGFHAALSLFPDP